MTTHVPLDGIWNGITRGIPRLPRWTASGSSGYLAAFPVQKALYDALVSGVLVDDAGINPNMLLKDSEYIYVCSIAIEPAYRDHTISCRMVERLLEKYRGKKLCLITVTEKGRRLAACYFKHRLRVTESVDVFVSE